jgi:hypothetical protein
MQLCFLTPLMSIFWAYLQAHWCLIFACESILKQPFQVPYYRRIGDLPSVTSCGSENGVHGREVSSGTTAAAHVLHAVCPVAVMTCKWLFLSCCVGSNSEFCRSGIFKLVPSICVLYCAWWLYLKIIIIWWNKRSTYNVITTYLTSAAPGTLLIEYLSNKANGEAVCTRHVLCILRPRTKLRGYFPFHIFFLSSEPVLVASIL